ncbi:putative quinol monooxygenase [Aeromicrobium fastidiosum]|uniref:Antibiotic biosynthesis monooxygenase n=1 Tax=Aeromicrobium fastidiosum TaxID=52699 RepID=A0A641AHR3_9ACTN|nr:putative quinol monooxygenase [Aeromicrobium fastidiosum]KAA1373652.1 antibiotic biosynthesis monooxygenase [Aeromicrobium fastidiosum]MBP2391207.1 quinol monooxygenase YgiN [Aeromicrobium fastidiosum]
MIIINVRFHVLPEHADQFPELTREFTEATRAEPGNRWFLWSRSVEDPNEYVVLEAFDDDAAEAHVSSDHFKKATAEMPQWLSSTPQIINTVVPDDGWGLMGEMQVDGPA